MTDSAPMETTQDAQASACAVQPSSQPTAPAPSQPAGHEWSQLQKYGDPEAVQRQLEWFQGFTQKYTDPAFAQKFDQLYGGPQQQQQHPLSWAKYDDAKMKSLRDAAQNNPNDPDFAKHSQFMNDFYYNPIGTLPQMLTHPDVMNQVYEAMQPQLQDFVSRMMEQQIQPIQQYVHQQGEQQFRQQYEKAYQGLPDHVKQAHQQGRFGEGRQGVINAIEFAKMSPQQQAAIGATAAPEKRPATENKNVSTNKTTPSESARQKSKEAEEKFARELEAAQRGKK
jgi:hypothetical protein